MIMKLITDSSLLALLSFSALTSDFTDRLFLTQDAFITLGAYIFFRALPLLHSNFYAFLCAAFISGVLGLLMATLTHVFKTSPILSSLAFSLIIEGSVRSLGGGKSEKIAENLSVMSEGGITILAVLATFTLIFFLFFTKRGLYLRLTGENAALLESRGISSVRSAFISWTIAACVSGLAGAFLCSCLGSYTPHISSSRGWLSLCAALCSRRKVTYLFVICIFFTILNQVPLYLSALVPHFSSFILVSLPYFACALFLLISTPELKK